MDPLTFRSPASLGRLKKYLDTISNYPFFDQTQMCNVYFASDKSFYAVESVKYNWVFTASDHKVKEILSAPYEAIEIPFNRFKEYVEAVANT